MDELKNIAPELSKIKKELPFKVPDNYFNDFPERLNRIIDKNDYHKEVLHSKKFAERFLKSTLKIAASLAVIAFLAYWPAKTIFPDYLANILPGKLNTTLTDEERILVMIEKIDENSFMSLVDESTIEKEKSSESAINDEELINYLCSNFSEYELFLQNSY